MLVMILFHHHNSIYNKDFRVYSNPCYIYYLLHITISSGVILILSYSCSYTYTITYYYESHNLIVLVSHNFRYKGIHFLKGKQ